MPTSCTGLLFPETIAQYPGVSQLLLFFDSLIHYLPVEDGLTPDSLLVKAGLLEQRLPAPLGEDLPSFQRLVRDMQHRDNTMYGAYLSSLSNPVTLAADEASVRNLISQLHPGPEGEDTPRKNALIQARLFLKLMEISRRDEEEIRTRLESLRHKKSRLLTALSGEEPDENTLREMLPAQEPENPERLRRRLKAWTRLLLEDEQPAPWLAVTTSTDLLEIIQETAVDLCATDRLFEITLAGPASGECPGRDYLSRRQEWRQSVQTIHGPLQQFLREAAAGSGRTAMPDRETLNQWQAAVSNLGAPGTASLRFHRFSLPLPELFRRLCGLESRAKQQQAAQPNTIIGVLS